MFDVCDLIWSDFIFRIIRAELHWPRYMNQHVVFTTPGLSAHSVYAACGAIAKSLLSDKAPDAWKIVAFHAFKFAVPTDDSIPWSLEGGDEKSMGKFFLLLTPMSESAVTRFWKRFLFNVNPWISE